MTPEPYIPSPSEVWLLNVIRVMHGWGFRRVYPKYVLPYYGLVKWEYSVRRTMKKLARYGYLEQIGGDGCRRGWRLNPRIQWI